MVPPAFAALSPLEGGLNGLAGALTGAPDPSYGSPFNRTCEGDRPYRASGVDFTASACCLALSGSSLGWMAATWLRVGLGFLIELDYISGEGFVKVLHADSLRYM